MARGYAARPGSGFWKICMDHPRFRMGFISFRVWLDYAYNASSAHFYPIVHCSENPEFMGWSYYAWWIERSGISGHCLRVNITIEQNALRITSSLFFYYI